MKKKSLTLLCWCLTLTTFAQQKSLFSQAASIYSNNTAGTTIYTIDAAMATDLQNLFSGMDKTQISAALSANPFITGKLQISPAAAAAFAPVNSAISGLGSLDVTNFANAIASLMIDRAKQELTLAFFERLSDFSKKYPEFQTMFPKTYDKMRNLLSYNYPQMLPALRDAFFADLEQLTFNLEAVLELPKYATLRANFREIKMAIQTLKVIHELEQGHTPAEVIADVDKALTDIETDGTLVKGSEGFTNVVATVHFAQVFSQSLQDADGHNIWITLDQAKQLITDENFARIYLALLYQQVSNKNLTYVFKGVSTPIVDLLKQNANNILIFQTKISQFLTLAVKVQQAYDQISTTLPIGTKPTPEQYYNFINTSLDAIDFTVSVVKIIDPKLQPDDYLAIARKANALYKDIYSKQYTQAVSDGVDIIVSVQELTKYDKKTVVVNVTGAPDYKTASSDLEAFVTKVKPYALFIGNVVDAKSEDDIKAALNNAILPVGSSSIKKNTSNNLSIQTYLGAYDSWYNARPDAARAWSNKYGVYGPIGLSYTPGFLSWGKWGSLSLFASVFDLGAIIDYKLKQNPTTKTSTNPATESATSKDYSVNLGQLFSPGIHVAYGFLGNIPLSLGIGAQYGPGLASVDAAGNTSVINPSWRYNIFLGVDLPFFNLINKSRSGK
ncbi:hypothetical protein [Mucilaginibacter sp.]|uniref:hypothetical protein n=1 Tax=Mucilaginibacter sp. TaxID=1882438 RepID=UPI00262676D3|nr:hypothetical protein [Mucilaginibacter sp.]MDB4922900.1 hypothetical protein [Mucilaginibacter sp.]